MARAADPRLSVRFSPEEFAAVERAAMVAGVASGALVRECAVRWGPTLAAAYRSGSPLLEGVKLRRRSEGKVARALEVRESVAKAREGKPLAFPSRDRP